MRNPVLLKKTNGFSNDAISNVRRSMRKQGQPSQRRKGRDHLFQSGCHRNSFPFDSVNQGFVHIEEYYRPFPFLWCYQTLYNLRCLFQRFHPEQLHLQLLTFSCLRIYIDSTTISPPSYYTNTNFNDMCEYK
mmetsp:Transcript_22601/g.63452  ORF Transcript_22601/g.63452 Transcript_22601/m.63452 type:complete len:132 (-) Transcript_22601:78-473(-)